MSTNDDDDSTEKDAEAPKLSAKAKAAAEKKLATDRIVAAIELLVAHIRSLPKYEMASKGGDISVEDGDVSSSHHCRTVFGVLVRILEEDGLPPSPRDRQLCKDSASRAAIRKAAGTGLIQLCEPSKQRDCFLDVRGWHTLGKIFCDSNADARESAVEQLSMMVTGQGSFSKVAPNLRFLSYVVLCADADGVSGNVSAANGGAANIGKRSSAGRAAALQCVKNLRNTCDAYLLQCKARGNDGEQMFENHIKPITMPEFALPYALHLLAFRKETPTISEDSGAVGTENSYKQLRRRMKWLLEPLIQSLGDQADNISFLLRMTELIANSFDCAELATDDEDAPKGSEGTEKLQTVCRAARECLLK